MLIDTDVIIWYMRGNQNAKEAINHQEKFHISVVTYIELIQGMRDKKELSILRNALKIWNCHIIYLSEQISSKAMIYVEEYFLSHSLQLADALIGATATNYSLPLLTGNDKHYRVIKEIELIKFNPEL